MSAGIDYEIIDVKPSPASTTGKLPISSGVKSVVSKAALPVALIIGTFIGYANFVTTSRAHRAFDTAVDNTPVEKLNNKTVDYKNAYDRPRHIKIRLEKDENGTVVARGLDEKDNTIATLPVKSCDIGVCKIQRTPQP